jgi:hypothetical protein
VPGEDVEPESSPGSAEVELGLGDGTGLGGVDNGTVSESLGLGEAGVLSAGDAEGAGDGKGGGLSPGEGEESEFGDGAELSFDGDLALSPLSVGNPFSTSVAFRFGSPISFTCSPR